MFSEVAEHVLQVRTPVELLLASLYFWKFLPFDTTSRINYDMMVANWQGLYDPFVCSEVSIIEVSDT